LSETEVSLQNGLLEKTEGGNSVLYLVTTEKIRKIDLTSGASTEHTWTVGPLSDWSFGSSYAITAHYNTLVGSTVSLLIMDKTFTTSYGDIQMPNHYGES
jgi:hypothetical protein